MLLFEKILAGVGESQLLILSIQRKIVHFQLLIVLHYHLLRNYLLLLSITALIHLLRALLEVLVHGLLVVLVVLLELRPEAFGTLASRLGPSLRVTR